MPQVQSHVSKQVVRRADLFSLQRFGGVAERCASAVPSCREPPIVVRCRAVELNTSIEEPEDMNTLARGLKHICPECTTRYYDLRKKVVACPRCGAKPLAAKIPKAAQPPAIKSGRPIFGRYR